MLVQCTQRERGGERKGGSALCEAWRQIPQRCILSKAKQGKYLSEFMRVAFIHWNLMERETPFWLRQWSYRLLPLIRSLSILHDPIAPEKAFLFPSQWSYLVLSANSQWHDKLSLGTHRYLRGGNRAKPNVLHSEPVFNAVPRALMCTHTSTPLQQPFFSDVA